MSKISSKLPRARLYIPFSALLKAVFRLGFEKIARGKKARAFEVSLEHYWDMNHCITVSSCRIALYFVLKNLKLQKGDEVLLTPITIPDIVNAIHSLGLKPVFVDLSTKDHNMNLADLKTKVSGRSRVLLMTHLCGLVTDMDKVKHISEAYNLILIEDISQNYGAYYKKKLLGSFGLAAVGSFSMAKTVSSLAGGAVLTNDNDLYEKIKLDCEALLSAPTKCFLFWQLWSQIKVKVVTSPTVFQFFIYYAFRVLSLLNPGGISDIQVKKFKAKSSYNHISFVENIPILRDKMPRDSFFWFSDLQSEIASSSFKKLSLANNKRRSLAKVLCNNLGDKARQRLPESIYNYQNNVYWHFPIMIEKNVGGFQQLLLKRGFDTTGYGLKLCSHEKAFHCYKQEASTALKIKNNTVFLPIHDSFMEKNMVILASAVNDFFERD